MKKIVLVCAAMMQCAHLLAMEEQQFALLRQGARIQELVQQREDPIRLQYELHLHAAQQNAAHQILLSQQKEQELLQLRARLAELEKQNGAPTVESKSFIPFGQWNRWEWGLKIMAILSAGFMAGVCWNEYKHMHKSANNSPAPEQQIKRPNITRLSTLHYLNRPENQ